jgi:TP901 family phage tail tape measure protein
MAQDINIRVGADISDLEKNLNKAQRALQRSGQQMSRIGNDMIMSLSVPIGLFGASVLSAASDFESSMNGMKAVTAGGADAFDALSAKAKELGATTQFSANEAAAAMEMLGRNGLTATQILEGAADASLSLAAATGTDLANAANIATDAMAQFGLKASDLLKVSDLITGATVNSKFSIDDFQMAMAQAGGVAGAVGVSFEDFAATIAAISPSFASGSDAGTSLKTMLTRLVPASKQAAGEMMKLGIITANGQNQFFDAAGNMKSMAEISGVLQTAFEGLSEAQTITASSTIFGTDAMRAGLKLAEVGAADFDKLSTSIQGVSAAEVAAIRMEGFKGAVLKLKSAFETLQLAIADSGVLSFATNMVEGLTSMALSLATLDPAILKVGTAFLGLIAAIGPAIKMVGMFQLLQASLAGNMATVVGVFTRLRAAVASFTTVQAALNAVMIANPIGVVVVAVAALAAAMYLLYQNSEVVRNAMDALFNNVLKPGFDFLVTVGKIIIDVFVSIAQSVMNTGRAVFEMFGAMQQAVINFIDKIPLVGRAVEWMQEAFRVAVSFIQKLFHNLPAVFAGLSAEAKATGEDLKRYFEAIAVTAQMIAKKVQLAMTLDGDARAALQKSINKLAEQKSALSKEGKAFGVAFKEAYNAEIAKMKAPSVTVSKTASAAPAVSGGAVVGGDFAAAAAAQKTLGDATKATTKEIEIQNEELAVAAVALNELQTAQLKMPESAAIMQQSFISMEQGVQKMRISTEELKGVMMDFNSGLTSALNQGAVDMAVGIGEMVGSMASGSSNMADLGAMLLGTLGGVLGQVGQLAISTGVAMLGIKAALQSLNPALAIVGGIALVALAGLVKSKAGSLGDKFGKGGKTPAFANGGLVDKPTFGVFGEAGPEVIIPKKKLDSYLSNMNGSGSGNGSLSARISGNDLLILLDKAKVRNSRV